MRHKRLAALLLLLSLLLTGCWNKVEIEENAYVLAIGVDEGEKGLHRITVAMAKPDKLAGKEGGGGGGGDGDEKSIVLSTLDAPSLTGAISMLNGFTGRNVTLQHAKAIFISEEVARAGNMKILDELIRSREIRQTIFFVVTRENAADFLDKMKATLTNNPMRYIEELTYNYRRNAMLPASSQVNTFVSQLDVNYAQPLTYYAALAAEDDGEPGEGKAGGEAEATYDAGDLPRTGGSNVEMVGGAAFRGRKMVGVLSADELRPYLLLQDAFRQAFVTYKDPHDPGSFVSVQLSRGRPFSVTVDVTGPRPRIRGRVSLEAKLIGVQSGVDYSEPALQAELEESIAKQIETSIYELVKRTQEWGSDVIGLGRHAVPLFNTVEAWEAYDWLKKYPDADIDVEVLVTLRRFGLTLSPLEENQ